MHLVVILVQEQFARKKCFRGGGQMKRLLSIISVLALFILGFGFQQNVLAANPVGTTISDVAITSTFDEFNSDITNHVYDVAYGATVSFDTSLASVSGYSFLFWQVNGTVQSNLPVDYSFTVTNNLDLVGVFKPTSKYAVVFMDSNGAMIDVVYVTSGADATSLAPSTAAYSKPGYEIASTPWDEELTNVTTDLVATLQYVPVSGPTEFTLAVENGTDLTGEGLGTYDLNTVVTVEADADTAYQEFMYWRVGGRIVSNQATYSFTLLQNTTITAVFGGIGRWVDEPVVTLTDGLSLRSGYDSFLGQYYLPSGLTYVEHGLVVSPTTADPTLDTSDMVQYSSTKINGTTKEFLMSLDNTSGVGNVRAYLVYIDGSNVLHTVYSENEVYASDLFISEYIEGGGTNKVIEIFNGTGVSVDLSAYYLELYSNGAATPSATVQLIGTLPHGEVVTLYNSGATADFKGLGYISIQNNSVINFNGDDALVLRNGEVDIDIFGQTGYDPGSAWTVNTITTVNKTLVRKISILSGRTDTGAFDPSVEWDQYAQDEWHYLGWHDADLRP